MEIIKRVYKQAVFIILPLALLSAFIGWGEDTGKMPLSIIVGGAIGLANLKGLVWGIESLLGTYKASTKLVFLSLLRLFILFAIIIILAALRLVNLFGLILGMTVVFALLIKEGLKNAKRET